MPEGDTIFRAARTMHRALAGGTIVRFECVFPQVMRADHDHGLRGRTIEHVESRGKHLLIWISAGLALRTHMRMHGSWHLYRPGERWRRPRADMRVLLVTVDFEAVGFNVPVVELLTDAQLRTHGALRALGPDLLADEFDSKEALTRLSERPDMEIADALLDQHALAGIGNVYKSEVLFLCRVNPFDRVEQVSGESLQQLVTTAARLLRANVVDGSSAAIVTYSGLRRTTGRADPGERLWVYGRAGKPCRRCGTPVQRMKQGPHARSTYWCEKCQRRSAHA